MKQSKKMSLNKRDYKNIFLQAVFLFGPMLITLAPEIKDVLVSEGYNPYYLSLIVSFILYIIKKILQGNGALDSNQV